MDMDVEQLAAMIDHTLLKPEATELEIKRLCEEAKRYGFGTVCINPYRVKYAAKYLEETSIVVGTVVGFPLGATTSLVKAYEAESAMKDGAREIDMVINIGALKDGNDELVYDDITEVVKTVRNYSRKAIIKIILETCLLTEKEIIKACEIAKEVGADFVKTSTGFSESGATVKDVTLMAEIVKDELGIKASGGIRTWLDAKAMIAAGATRIGTSSGIKIIEEFTNLI